MSVKWNVDADGKTEVPMLSGFAMTALDHRSILLVQLQCAGTGLTLPQEDIRLQYGVSPDGARELAAALLRAVELMEDAPIVGKLN